MVSGNMVPSFPSSVVTLRLLFYNLLFFTFNTLITELVDRRPFAEQVFITTLTLIGSLSQQY
ncbi:hypothetical protein [Virgibacillus salinus]|uniref:Uncharacterized protein n=1 Tax=Virgibacillus salinus TaxID=553311 RepID=A0A1H1FPG2_9BACI|nr:hypothetical protein [Virgibacillus salinus]SDR02765.1 hypothetical protein SAMN05216231_3332 [Virgibacillus salinus]